MVHGNFIEINENDQLQISGGGVLITLLICGLCVVGGIVADETVERTTGNDIAGHLGNLLVKAGEFLIK
jgi:hypothetical protein